MNSAESILIVEDSLTQAEGLRYDLQSAFPDRAVTVARNGKEALDLVDRTTPNLIISDVVMPVMDGYEMCDAIKQNPDTKHIPIILLTSLSDPEDIIKGLNAGTDYYLTKPYEADFLLSKVSSILDRESEPQASESGGWRINFAGREHVVQADLQQMLNLLLSTYESAVQQNRKLLAVQEELRRANETLEERVRARTVEITSAYERLRVEVGERKNAEERLQLQLRRLDALRHIDAAITGSLDLRVTLNVLLDQVTTHLNIDAADVLLSKSHSARLESAASRGFRHSSAIPRVIAAGPAAKVARDRRMLRIDDLLTEVDPPLPSDILNHEEFTGYIALPLIAKGRAEGVLEVYTRSAFNDDEEWLGFLEALAGQAAVAIDSALLFENLQKSNAELFDAYETTLEGWSRALDLRDKETEGHSIRVTEMTEMLARRLGVSDSEMIHIRRGALLHDIGKLGVPDDILRKPGPLDGTEREIMEKHATHAYEMLAPIAFLRAAIDIPYCHHEKWDGTGYPRGLRHDQIPLAARIFAVADVWDALRSDRPYRNAWTRKRVLDHIVGLSGSHFDPKVVEALEQLYEEHGEKVDTLPEPMDVGISHA